MDRPTECLREGHVQGHQLRDKAADSRQQIADSGHSRDQDKT